MPLSMTLSMPLSMTLSLPLSPTHVTTLASSLHDPAVADGVLLLGLWLAASASPAAARRWFPSVLLREGVLGLAPLLGALILARHYASAGAPLAVGVHVGVLGVAVGALVCLPLGYSPARLLGPGWAREALRLGRRPGDPSAAPSRWRRHSRTVGEHHVALLAPRMWTRASVGSRGRHLLHLAGPSPEDEVGYVLTLDVGDGATTPLGTDDGGRRLLRSEPAEVAGHPGHHVVEVTSDEKGRHVTRRRWSTTVGSTRYTLTLTHADVDEGAVDAVADVVLASWRVTPDAPSPADVADGAEGAGGADDGVVGGRV